MSVTGKTLEELFCDALLGMVEAMKPRKDDRARTIRRTMKLDASDTTALLIDFLSEALVWMHTKREVYAGVRFISLGDRSLEAELAGFITESFGEDIKAVTYHEADVKRNAEGIWSSNIIFDI